jgi:hypothetical protein
VVAVSIPSQWLSSSHLTWQDHEEICAREDDVVSPSDRGESMGRDFCHQKAEDIGQCGTIIGFSGTHLKIHALPVLIAVMGTRACRGLISLAYKNVRPRKPTGKKRLKRKINAQATPTQARLCD